MKTRSYFIWIVIFCISLSSITSQQFNKKLKTMPAPSAGKNALTVNPSESAAAANIAQNLTAYMKKHGINPNSLKTAATYQQSTLTPKFNAVQIPSMLGQKNNIQKIIWNDESGTPRFIEMKKSVSRKTPLIQTNSDKKETARNFLVENKSLLKISNPENEFEISLAQEDVLGFTHVRFNQLYKGIKVWARELIVHLDKSGTVLSLNGNYEVTPSILVDLDGKIDRAGAISIAVKNLSAKKSITSIQPLLENILDYHGPAADKIIWYNKYNVPHLAWFIEARASLSNDWYYFIDAETGNILDAYNNVCFDGISTGSGVDLNGVTRTFGTYQVGSDFFMIDASQPMYNAGKSKIPDDPVGAIVNLDLRNKDLSSNSSIYYVTSNNNQWSDAASVSAHYNAIVTYNYYHSIYKRNSIDGNGMTIYSIVHATEDGKAMENAFWSGKVMCYGDGEKYFKPLAGGLDVAAHEMTHGVTQYTANLEYKDQSGALNESMSDVFGALVDSTNWQIGEEIIKDLHTFPTGAMRDMVDPHNGGTQGSTSWQPGTMSEFVTTTQDNGGVHINSGIPNHAFYHAANSIGRPKAGQIWYRTLTTYLTRSSQFIDARLGTIKAATDLYGETSSEVTAVKNAWDAVEVFEGNSTPPPPTSTISGDQWVLVTNTDTNDPNTIYMAKPTVASASDLYALSRTPVSNRPAITDGSGIILFIDSNHNLRALNANPQNPGESIIDGSGVWWSVAAGPGLSALALTSIYRDTTIYYFDFVNNVSNSFKIVTKSYDAKDVKTALFADALSFDPSGRYLLFDSYNEIRSSLGDTIGFWNINILDVQTGNMQSVFPPANEGINVGDPSFSKVSPTRFTFDYIDSNNQQAYVMAVDFNTGDLGVVTGPLEVLGYPTYSGDDKTIAFHTALYDNAFVPHHVVHQIALKDNMIESASAATSYLVDATYPGWFVIGTRVTDVNDQAENIPSSFLLHQNYPNPFNPETIITYQISPENILRGMNSVFVTLKIYDVFGREVSTLVNQEQKAGVYRVAFNAQSNSNYGKLTSGIYFYSLRAGNDFQTKKMVLMK